MEPVKLHRGSDHKVVDFLSVQSSPSLQSSNSKALNFDWILSILVTIMMQQFSFSLSLTWPKRYCEHHPVDKVISVQSSPSLQSSDSKALNFDWILSILVTIMMQQFGFSLSLTLPKRYCEHHPVEKVISVQSSPSLQSSDSKALSMYVFTFNLISILVTD